jgi:hypothetical protein
MYWITSLAGLAAALNILTPRGGGWHASWVRELTLLLESFEAVGA